MAVNLVIVAAILIAASAFGLLRKRSDGRVRLTGAAGADSPSARLLADDLGTALGHRATFLQFSSEMCQPCRATARVLTEVSTQEDGVAHVELDAEQHLDLVRRLGVLRTPTVFVLDRHGAVTGRAAGAMRKAEALTALAALEAAV